MRCPGILENHTLLTCKIVVLKAEYGKPLISRGMRVLKGESEKYMILTESQVSGPPQESETCRPGICLSRCHGVRSPPACPGHPDQVFVCQGVMVSEVPKGSGRARGILE